MEIKGWISTFLEQGIEEMPWLILQDENFAASRLHGWQREGMHRLSEGDHLTIMSDDGQVVWTGILHTRRIKWRKITPQDYRWHPPDVDYQKWQDWFGARPPHRAICIIR